MTGWPKGKKRGAQTLEHKAKLREANPVGYWAGKKLSKDHRQKLSIAHQWSRPWMVGTKRTDETKLKISRSRTGKAVGVDNPNWKGGTTTLYEKIRSSRDYALWRKAVYERDGFACVLCGDDKGGNLEADHILPFAHYKELRFEVGNGRTLCKPCHQKTDTYAGRGFKRVKQH